jgi:hypothetical protein
MIASLIAPGTLTASCFGIRAQNGAAPTTRQLSHSTTNSKFPRAKPGAGKNNNASSHATFRCQSAASTPGTTGARRRPDSPVPAARHRGRTAVVAAAAADAAVKPTFDANEPTGYSKPFLLVRLTVFLSILVAGGCAS